MRPLANGANLAAGLMIMTSLWSSSFFPALFVTALAAPFAAVAITLGTRGAVRLFPIPGATFDAVPLLPIAGLGVLSGFRLVHFDSVWAILGLGLAFATLALAVLWGPVRNALTRRELAILIWLGLACYGAGALAGLDRIYDRAPPTFTPVRITNKYSSSRGSTYSLEAALPEGAPAGRYYVTSIDYDAVPVGSHLCIAQHSGGLGWSWSELDECPRPGQSP